jgi:hypothetical protein
LDEDSDPHLMIQRYREDDRLNRPRPREIDISLDMARDAHTQGIEGGLIGLRQGPPERRASLEFLLDQPAER